MKGDTIPEGFTQIRARELALLSQVIHEGNGGDLEDTLRKCQFIDRALLMMKSRSLLAYKRPKIKLAQLKTAKTWLGHDLNMLLVSTWPHLANKSNPYEMNVARNSQWYQNEDTTPEDDSL